MPKRMTVRRFEPEALTSEAEALAEFAHLHNETVDALKQERGYGAGSYSES